MNPIPEKAMHFETDWNTVSAEGKKQLRLGLSHEKEGDYEKAETCYLKAASCANVIALYRLGLLERRKGSAFASQAACYFTRATRLCYPPAADELWKLYQEGRLPVVAAGWFSNGVLFHAKLGRAWAQRFAARPARGGASGASNMPNNESTGDRYEMRPIDVELREARATKLRIQGVLCQTPMASPHLTSR